MAVPAFLNVQTGYRISRHRHSIASRKGRYAFTLVELLVVVAIIALLVSILLPTLNKARDQARAVVCMTNLKNIALASTMYSHDYNNWVHAAWGNYVDRGGDGKSWYRVMVALDLLPEVSESNSLSYCPDRMTPKDEWGRYSYGQRACFNSNDGAYGSGYFHFGGNEVRCRRAVTGEFFYPYMPAEFVLFADTRLFHSVLGVSQWFMFYDDKTHSSYISYDIEMRHADKANCGFADSHVENLNRTELNNAGFSDTHLWPEP